MTSCLIAAGGNIKISPEVIFAAFRELESSEIQIERISQPVQTTPVGSLAGSTYLNAATLISTSLAPRELLQRLHDVENKAGRVRSVHWGPRTLDLDLIYFGDLVLDHPEIVVPHPAMWYRDFVLRPAAEIVPDMVHPILGSTTKVLFDRLSLRPIILELSGMIDGEFSWLQAHWQREERFRDLVRIDLKTPSQSVTDAESLSSGFAEIICLPVKASETCRTQPGNCFGRTIQLFRNQPEETLAGLKAIATSILG